MSWTHGVQCVGCRVLGHWHVKAGVWTCTECGAVMSMKMIAEYQKRIPAR